jgi:pyridoxal phosphate enzyme (YggS family)
VTDSIAERWAAIRAQLAQVAPGRSVAVIAVAKFQPIERLREARAAGITRFGQNYAQEGESAMVELGRDGIEWHFIGHIQSRKVKYLVDYDCVQSLDRFELAQSLNEKLQASGKQIDILVELNIGGEAQKSGIDPTELGPFLERLRSLPAIRVKGLMVMPPPLQPVELRRPFFRRAKEWFDRYEAAYSFSTLSMGTSEDYLVAVEEGASMIRLGTVLMGERPARPTSPAT